MMEMAELVLVHMEGLPLGQLVCYGVRFAPESLI